MRGDEELDKFVKATIAGGGVIPHIEQELMGNSKSKAVKVESEHI